MIFCSERRIAQVLIPFGPGQVEVCQPYITVTAAGGDESHIPAIRRPNGGMVRGGVFGDGQDGLTAVVDRNHRNFEVFFCIGFKGKPLRVGRPGWGRVIFRGSGDLGDFPILQVHHIQIPKPAAVRGEGKLRAVRAEGRGDVVPIAAADACQWQVLRALALNEQMSIPVLFDG